MKKIYYFYEGRDIDPCLHDSEPLWFKATWNILRADGQRWCKAESGLKRGIL